MSSHPTLVCRPRVDCSGAVQGCLLAIAAAAAAISTADPDLQALTAAAEAAAERAVAEREARRARDIASQERDAGVGGVTDGTRVDEGGKPAATGAATGDDVPGETPLQGQASRCSYCQSHLTHGRKRWLRYATRPRHWLRAVTAATVVPAAVCLFQVLRQGGEQRVSAGAAACPGRGGR